MEDDQITPPNNNESNEPVNDAMNEPRLENQPAREVSMEERRRGVEHAADVLDTEHSSSRRTKNFRKRHGR